MKKIINGIIPYYRSYAVFETTRFKISDGETQVIAPISLPLINSAVTFLANNDLFIINDVDALYKLSYIDYQLIGTEQVVGPYKANFDQFVNTAKLFINRDGIFTFKICRRVVINNDIHIKFEVVENEDI